MIMRKMTCVLPVVCLLLVGLSGPAQSGIIDPDFLGERIAPDSTVVEIFGPGEGNFCGAKKYLTF